MRYFSRLVLFLLTAPVIHCPAQEDEAGSSFERSKSWFFQIKAGALNGGHKQAAYFDGTHTNYTFYQLYSVPLIYNDINASTGYTTYLGEFPPPMRYQWGVQFSGSFYYYFSPTFAAFMRFNGSRIISAGAFLLFADDPANPSGEPLTFQQQMRGLELRTWYLGGMRFESETLEKGEINPFLEIGLLGGGIKPIRNEAVVEGKRYNLFTYNPNISTESQMKTGFGLSASLGVISWIRANKAVEISTDISWVRLKILANSPNAFYWSISAGFML